jgi:hypothetical protein
LFAQKTEELQTLRNELKALAPEYKEIKAKLPGLREERRIAGMSEQDYYYEQMGMKSDAQIAAETSCKRKSRAAKRRDARHGWTRLLRRRLQNPLLNYKKNWVRRWMACVIGVRLRLRMWQKCLADNPALMFKVYEGRDSHPRI